jgi:hypothetical protein
MSVLRSISVTRETRGTFWAADLNGKRKLHVELGLENNQLATELQKLYCALDVENGNQFGKLRRLMVRKKQRQQVLDIELVNPTSIRSHSIK